MSELAVVCLLQVGDDDLLHLEHGVCHSFGFFRVRVIHQLAERLALLAAVEEKGSEAENCQSSVKSPKNAQSPTCRLHALLGSLLLLIDIKT